MNYIPLPDELVRKVYDYIHPAFEYAKYVRALIQHEAQSRLLPQIYNRHNNIVGINERINYNEIIIEYMCLMNQHLFDIRNFIKANPLFERPRWNDGHYLTEDLYKWQGDAGYSKNQVERMEKNIHRRRGKDSEMVRFDGNKKSVLLYHDIVYMMRKGSLETIMHNCRMNNIYVIDEPYGDMLRKAAGWINKADYRNYLVKLLLKV